MKILSPWAIAAKASLASLEAIPIFNADLGHLKLELQLDGGSLWAICSGKDAPVAFRVAYSPDEKLSLERKSKMARPLHWL